MMALGFIVYSILYFIMCYVKFVHVCLEHLRWVEEHGPRDHVAVQRYLRGFSEFEGIP